MTEKGKSTSYEEKGGDGESLDFVGTRFLPFYGSGGSEKRKKTRDEAFRSDNLWPRREREGKKKMISGRG